jgi:hypothetical protein
MGLKLEFVNPPRQVPVQMVLQHFTQIFLGHKFHRNLYKLQIFSLKPNEESEEKLEG